MVLIIDDDANYTRVLSKFLADVGQIVVAGSIDEGVRLAELHHPAVVMLDVMFEGHPAGMGLISYLRKVLKCEVVVMTADYCDDDLCRSVALDAVAYLSKGDSALLTRAARAAMRAWRAQRTTR